MPRYEVIKPCYVPLGRGTRYRPAGQFVTLEVEEAEKLDGYLRPVGEEPVQFLDTAAAVDATVDSEPVQFVDTPAEVEQEVIDDASDPQAGDE